MFAINLRRLYYVCDKITVRSLRNPSKRHAGPGPNPGLDNRLSAFKEDGITIQGDDTEEFIEQSESSFYDVGETYNAHLNETLIGKHELRHHIVKDKYFKENMPNLLTWSEKEQIRHLATTQPEEWTPQRIAESFPVTAQIVKKLLKYPWKPASEDRIARHDQSAMRNWKELKEGTLDIPDKLRQHFLKFSDRTIPPLNKKSIKIDISDEKIGEFEQIVRRCATNVENKNERDKYESDESDSNETKAIKKTDWKRVTLDELATKIKNRMDKGKDINIPDKMIMETVTTTAQSSVDIKTINSEINLSSESDENKSLSNFKENENKLIPTTTYPERIRIPKKAYKKGATYKVNDCFYDHDGRFLYRVLGITENQNKVLS